MTQARLAALVGLDVSTVSRALRGDTARVSAATIARVRELAQRHGYQPNLVAATLRRGRSGVMGVLVPDLTDAVVATLFQHIASTAQAAGYFAIVTPTYNSPSHRAAVATAYASRGVDGVIIADAPARSPVPDAISDAHLPFVFALRSGGLVGTSVVADDVLGGRMAAEHLLDLGHRDICVLAGPPDASTARDRVHGFAEEVRRAGSPLPGERIAYSEFGVRPGYEAMMSLLVAGCRPSGVFAVNDYNAIGASRALQEHGVVVGSQVAMVGYNDISLCPYLPVPLSSVHNQLNAIGAVAATSLIEAIEGGDPTSTVIAPMLVVRESSSEARPRR